MGELGMSTHCCPICQGEASVASRLAGEFIRREFELCHCPACHFSFVGNPVLDYGRVYSEAYYRGQGADPLVDYFFELEHPGETIRHYEWAGLLRAVQGLVPLSAAACWLDYGCGNGGLVRYARQQGFHHVCGFDEGAIVPHARQRGVPILDRSELERLRGRCEVVTAVEVLEHVPDPLATLRGIRQFLRPGGLFFFTTGNARPYRHRLARWGYVIPEIHLSYYEPETLVRALEATGFRAESRRWLTGWSGILRFKILKNLRVRRRNIWERLLPWGLLTRLANRRYGVTHHPIGWAR